MKLKQYFAGLCCLMLLIPSAVSCASEAETYRASQYFDRGYSAYASAVPANERQYRVEVTLQLAAEIAPHAGIASYTLWVNGKAHATLSQGQNAYGVTLPGFFTCETVLPDSPASLSVVPTLLEGGDAQQEAIDLMPPLTAGSRVGTVAVVSNPNPDDRLNLRVAPDSQASSLRHYYNGVPVRILNECPDGWVSVCIGAEGGMARGYMKSDFLAFGADAESIAPKIPTETAAVSSWTLYSLPDEASAAVGTYDAGEAFQVLGESTAWQHIQVGDITGFVRAGAITAQDGPDPVPSPVATDSNAGADSTYLPTEDGTRMIVWSPAGSAAQP